VPVGLLVIAAVSAWLSARNERRRTQPVVICNERASRTFSRDSVKWVTAVYLTNEGGGPAFNVRLGLRMRALHFPWRCHRFPWRAERLEGRPSRARVIRADERFAKADPLSIYIDSVDLAVLAVAGMRRPRRAGTIDDGRVYWCRYENAYGQTWETRNPHDPTADLRIRRVRFPRVHEWVDARRARRLHAAGVALDASLGKGMIEEAKAAEANRIAELTAQAVDEGAEAGAGKPPPAQE
jgi:hypothetical protein